MSLAGTVDDYFEDIDLTPTVMKRLHHLAGVAADMLNGDTVFDRAFVSEYVGEDGQRTYENAWFMGDQLLVEAHNMMTEAYVDYMILSKDVKYIWQKRTSFTPGKASVNSRFTLQFVTFGGVSGLLKASGNNCDYLHKIAKNVIMPHLSPGAIGEHSGIDKAGLM